MLFVQIIFLAIFTLPLAIEKLYATLTMNIPKSPLQITIEDFMQIVEYALLYNVVFSCNRNKFSCYILLKLYR
jgi:hypothetical protein